MTIRKIQRLGRQRCEGGIVEEWLVEVGSGQTAPKQRLRYVCLRRNKVRYELLSNVLDPRMLSARMALAW